MDEKKPRYSIDEAKEKDDHHTRRDNATTTTCKAANRETVRATTIPVAYERPEPTSNEVDASQTKPDNHRRLQPTYNTTTTSPTTHL